MYIIIISTTVVFICFHKNLVVLVPFFCYWFFWYTHYMCIIEPKCYTHYNWAQMLYQLYVEKLRWSLSHSFVISFSLIGKNWGMHIDYFSHGAKVGEIEYWNEIFSLLHVCVMSLCHFSPNLFAEIKHNRQSSISKLGLGIHCQASIRLYRICIFYIPS